MSRSDAVTDADGYVAKGTALSSKAELLELPEAWLKASEAATIGPIGKYGGRPWISITLDRQRTAVLNADTKRAASRSM